MTDVVMFSATKGKATLESWAVEVGTTVVPLASIPDEPSVTFTFTEADAHAYREGALDLSVGFMRGRVKMSGDFGALLRVLPRLSAL
jgi:hypothetical protein